LRDRWPQEGWSIVAEFLGPPDQDACVIARVRMLVESAPKQLLEPGSEFDLFEGATLTGHGVVLGPEG
jgi:hypothetical protein